MSIQKKSTKTVKIPEPKVVFNTDEIKYQDLAVVLDAEIDSKSRTGLKGEQPMPGRGLIYSSLESVGGLCARGIHQVVIELFRIDIRLTKSDKKIDEDRDIDTISCVVNFTKVEIGRPTYTPNGEDKPRELYPNTARRFHSDYTAPMKIWAKIKARAFRANGGELPPKEFEINGHPIGRIPVMVNTENCNLYGRSAKDRANICMEDPNDPGGYYIIKGQEWVVSFIENAIYNQPRIYRNLGHEKEVARCEIISKQGESYEHSFETVIVYHDDGNLTVELSGARDLRGVQFPFYVVFRLLGMNFDKEIVDNIVYSYGDTTDESSSVGNYMLNAIKGAFQAPSKHFGSVRNITDQAELIIAVAGILNSIMQSRRTSLADLEKEQDDMTENNIAHLLKNFDRYLLPHVGTGPASRRDKLRYLGLLIHKTFLVEMQVANSTDRDSLAEKRIHAPGHSFMKVFKRVFNKAVVKKISNKIMNDLKTNPFNQTHLDLSFRNALGGRELEQELTKAIIIAKKDKPVRGRQQPSILTSELMVRKNQLNFLSTCRVVRTNSSAATKMAQRGEEMRQAHPSYAGYIDMIQSADTGEQVGMVRQICLGAFICESSSSLLMRDILLKDSDIIPLRLVLPYNMGQRKLTRIMVNGGWIGCTSEAPRVLRRYTEARRGWEVSEKSKSEKKSAKTGRIPFLEVPAVTKQTKDGFEQVEPAVYSKFEHREKHSIDNLTTIYWDTDSDELCFWTDNSRFMRPLLVVRNNGELDPVGRQYFAEKGIKPHDPYKPAEESGFVQDLVITREDIRNLYNRKTDITKLIAQGKIEYISSQEIRKLVIAGHPKTLVEARHDPRRPYTHCEIPQALLGLPALTCPFANHNQAPRIIFQTNQSKQTCGVPFKNYPYRSDKHTFLQYQVNYPLVPTIANKYLYPNGMNAIVAIDSYDGYNQEDSIVGNLSSSQRGMFCGEHYNFIKRVLRKGEKLGKSTRADTVQLKSFINYELLDEHGLLKNPRQILKQHDPVVGVREAEPQQPGQPRTYIDKTVEYKYVEPGIVNEIITGRDPEGNEVVKVKVSSLRDWDTGSKFSSRHGQKGMTGIMRTQSDFPFSKRGITPSLILSPHAIPSRMTIAQLIESNCSKLGAVNGTFTDGTIFTPIDMNKVGDELHKLGFDRYGTEVMYNGLNGDHMDVEIFIGPVYYQRLQKFVVDELYSISVGPTSVLTRQPVEGRAHGGALRIGEMEQAVIIAHGAGHFLMEKFRDDSDGYDMYVCRICNKIPVVNEEKGIIKCKTCESAGMEPDVVKVKTTWTTKLLLQELEAMMAGTLLGVEPFEYEAPLNGTQRE